MTKTLLLDTLERMLRTAVQAAAAAWLVTQDVSLAGAKIAGVAALVSVAMSLAASQRGSSDSASVLDEPAADVGGGEMP